MSNRFRIKPKKEYNCCGLCYYRRRKEGICEITHLAVWKYDKPCAKYIRL